MKKYVCVLLIGLLAMAAAFADHPDKGIGIGALGNIGGNNHGVFYNPGLSLKIGGIPVFWGIQPYLSTYGIGGSITGDYYIFDRNIVETELSNEDGLYDFKLDWYLGVGGLFNMVVWNDEVSFDAGVRIPGGVSWHVVEKWEVFAGVVGGVGVFFGKDDFGPHWSISGEVGFRYWI